ncbi:hypothetical protein GCM10018793_37670 [Streptomyces sulfonofaciens]|uniref:Uncharacterized protein n=1 Tax=Streptomyces sulfonofaciens TaxID=68272 RepID=A0A919GAJ9_9ACTN|nr:hypothetical protein GCM10018793_37670 [Streptomyces sulfonofaciens]
MPGRGCDRVPDRSAVAAGVPGQAGVPAPRTGRGVLPPRPVVPVRTARCHRAVRAVLFRSPSDRGGYGSPARGAGAGDALPAPPALRSRARPPPYWEKFTPCARATCPE